MPDDASREPLLDEDKIEELRSLLGDGPDGVDGLVDTFVDRIPDVLDALREAAREGDLEEVSRQAHKVKGESATLGATRLSSHAKRIENQAREEDLAEPEQAVQGLVATYEDTERAFQERGAA